jgi:hypothetical protein
MKRQRHLDDFRVWTGSDERATDWRAVNDQARFLNSIAVGPSSFTAASATALTRASIIRILGLNPCPNIVIPT